MPCFITRQSSGLTRRVGGNNVGTVHDFAWSAYSYSHWLTILSTKVYLCQMSNNLPSRNYSWWPGVVDLRRALLVHAPLWTKVFSISCSFSENLVKIICWHPPLEGWCNFLRKSWIHPWMCTTYPLAVITGLGEVVVVVRSDLEGGW